MSETTWKYVSLGGTHSAAIDSNDELWIWGSNNKGEAGLRWRIWGWWKWTITISTSRKYSTWKYYLRAQVSFGRKDFSIGLDSNGDLWTWGENNYGQLGLGNYTSYDTPQNVEHLNIVDYPSMDITYSNKTSANDGEGITGSFEIEVEMFI